MALSVPCETQAQFKHKAYVFLANIWIFTIFISWTVFFLPFGLALVYVAKAFNMRKGPYLTRLAIHFYGRVTWLLLHPFVPVDVHNTNDAKDYTPCIFIVNHQSFLDLFLFGAQYTPHVVFVSKAWPYKKLFFFAPMMRYAEYIDIESSTTDEIESKCRKLFNENVSIAIFPEGKRTRDGQLGRFHVGAFQLAQNLNVPVVPLVIENSGAVFPVGAKYFNPKPIHLRMLTPLMPQNFASETLPHRAMMRAARTRYIQYFNA